MSKSSSLCDLMQYLQDVVNASLEKEVWVNAEIADYRPARNGHVYLELVENRAGSVVAKVKANLWSRERNRIEAAFEKTTGNSIRQGMKVLLLVRPDLHPIYGLSLHIKDIDPVYSVGELARQRQETLQKLTEADLIDRNRSLDLPLLPKRLAVISSPSAAGYGDLRMQLDGNPSGYSFITTLFPAVMQGEGAADSVAGALAEIAQRPDDYDLILIIRGGGSILDLNCFDELKIGRAIAISPLPVFTGIGHERDETVADLVAHTRLKTPTAVAEHIIGMMRNAEMKVDNLAYSITTNAQLIIDMERRQVGRRGTKLVNICTALLKSTDKKLKTRADAIVNFGKQSLLRSEKILTRQQGQMLRNAHSIVAHHKMMSSVMAEKIRALDPDMAAKRGFIMVSHDGKWVREADELQLGDSVKLHFAQKTIRGEIRNDEEKNE